MKEIVLKGLDEKIYCDECENGLGIYVWVNPKINTVKGSLTYIVGSEDVEFKVGSTTHTVPFGTAHYLEHMMCKDENGSYMLKKFQELGCYSNASTYAYKTVYEFVGSENIKEAINLLLDVTQEKEFSLDAFEKERGPILEEARRNLDNASRDIMIELNKSLFHSYPNRTPGVGTLEDIQNISLEDLKLLYRCFYHPKNSFITVTGNVNPREVIRWVKDNQNQKEFPKYQKPVLKKYREPKKVVEKYKEIATTIEVPQVYLVIKTPLKPLEEYDINTILNGVQVVLSSNFGTTSLLKEELTSKNLVTTLGAMAWFEKDYLLLQVVSKTKYPEEVIPILKEKLCHLEILEEDIERKKKGEIANLVLGYEDPESVNDFISYSIAKFGHIWDDEKESFENLTIPKVKSILGKVSTKELTILVAKPKTHQKQEDTMN